MHPIALVILVLLISLVVLASRRVALLAMLAGALYLSQTQAYSLMGLNMFGVRFLEIAAFLRVVARREYSNWKFNKIDKTFALLYAFSTIVYCLRSTEGSAFQIGLGVDAFLTYCSCRSLLQEAEDFRWLLRAFALLLIPFVLALVVERATGESPFAFMGWGAAGSVGGVENWVRGDRVRCFGSFRHPSLLGTVGVGFTPLFIGLAFRRGDRMRAAIGIGACLLIIWAANSGGPISALGVGLLGWVAWRLRTKMKTVRWSIAILICAAAILMKAPIWYLVAHVSAVTGGDGWHRAYLMDVSFRNLGLWWFDGMSLRDTAGWFPYGLAATQGSDITNQFISFGLNAGLGALVLFVALLTFAFAGLGTALANIRSSSTFSAEDEPLIWGLGCMLAGYLANWLGIIYFDQTWVFWFAQLAAISSIYDQYAQITPEAAVTPTLAEEPVSAYVA